MISFMMKISFSYKYTAWFLSHFQVLKKGNIILPAALTFFPIPKAKTVTPFFSQAFKAAGTLAASEAAPSVKTMQAFHDRKRDRALVYGVRKNDARLSWQ